MQHQAEVGDNLSGGSAPCIIQAQGGIYFLHVYSAHTHTRTHTYVINHGTSRWNTPPLASEVSKRVMRSCHKSYIEVAWGKKAVSNCSSGTCMWPLSPALGSSPIL